MSGFEMVARDSRDCGGVAIRRELSGTANVLLVKLKILDSRETVLLHKESVFIQSSKPSIQQTLRIQKP